MTAKNKRLLLLQIRPLSLSSPSSTSAAMAFVQQRKAVMTTTLWQEMAVHPIVPLNLVLTALTSSVSELDVSATAQSLGGIRGRTVRLAATAESRRARAAAEDQAREAMADVEREVRRRLRMSTPSSLTWASDFQSVLALPR